MLSQNGTYFLVPSDKSIKYKRLPVAAIKFPFLSEVCRTTSRSLFNHNTIIVLAKSIFFLDVILQYGNIQYLFVGATVTLQ